MGNYLKFRPDGTAVGLLAHCLCLQASESISAPHASPRARVVIASDPQATSSFKANARVVESMLNRGLTNLTGTASITEACLSLAGTNDFIGIKVYTAPGSDTGTRPQVAAAVVKGLLAAGFATNHIIVWDRHTEELERAGAYRVYEDPADMLAHIDEIGGRR